MLYDCVYIYIYIYICRKIYRIIRAPIRLIYNGNRSEHLKTDENQHNLKWLLFRKRCKHRLLCLAHKSIFYKNM